MNKTKVAARYTKPQEHVPHEHVPQEESYNRVIKEQFYATYEFSPGNILQTEYKDDDHDHDIENEAARQVKSQDLAEY